jgi:hypothetical protein
MRRRSRVALTLVVAASCALAIVGLTRMSAGSEGPVSSFLGGIASAVGSIEHGVFGKFRRGDRVSKLAWYEPMREKAAALRAPDRVLLGAYDSGIPQTLEGVGELESRLGVTLPLIQIYTAFGDKPEEQFPRQLVQAIHDAGSTPLVTWEPWLSDFENAKHPGIPLRDHRDSHGLAGVAAGAYDEYLDDWAQAAKQFAHPIFVRFGHEMNDPYRYPWGPQNNTKEEYIAAWRHIVDRFRAAGATNVLWVWAPHVAYEYWELYYPGDAYVDWVGTGALNFGPIAQWAGWWSFAEIFGKHYAALAKFGKPVMVAEFGSLAVGGDRAKWYHDALADIPKRYPNVRALLFFNTRNDQTVTYQKVDWSVTDDSLTVSAIRSAIAQWKPPPR